MDLTRLPNTDPAALYRPRDSIYATDLLTAALAGLDLFTALDEQPRDKPTLCRDLGLIDRPTDVMLTLFSAMELLDAKDGVFDLTELAREHLVRRSPWYLGPYYASLKDRPAVQDFLKVLRTGRPANWGSLQNHEAWIQAMKKDEFAAQFTAAMDCRGLYLGRQLALALDLRSRTRLLDIAGGSGIYACSLAAANPHLHATVLERPPVDRLASRWIAQRGLEGRVSVASGDMFKDPLPAGHDVHLISNVLHDWDEAEVRRLLDNSCAALPSGGLLIIHDAHINRTKTGPVAVAEYSAFLMHGSEGKCYAFSELESYLSKTGFGQCGFQDTAAFRSVVTAAKP